MFKHMAKMRIPEAIVVQELAQADADGWELVSVVSTSSISGDRAVSMFFKKDVRAEEQRKLMDLEMQTKLAKLQKELKKNTTGETESKG
jgi:hypothetical protein